MKTDRELLDEALSALHDIGGAYSARTFARATSVRAVRDALELQALTDEKIEKLALDTWARIATELATR